MRSLSVVFVCTLALACADDETVECAVDDQSESSDDRCQLLQSDIGVVSHHKGHSPELKTPPAQLAKSVEVVEKGWPEDLMKKITNALGGVEEMQKKFEAVKSEVATFSHDVHQAIHALTESLKTNTGMDWAIAQVSAAEKKIHASAMKLWDVLKQLSTTFMKTIGSVAPESFKSAMKSSLDHLSEQAKKFADSFNEAADKLKNVNKKEVCATVKHHLAKMHKKVEAFAASALGLSSKGLSKDILKAKDALPGKIKEEIDKILEKANEAAERLKSSSSSTVQEISMGIAQALKGHCPDLSAKSAAGQLEVSLLTALMLGLSLLQL